LYITKTSRASNNDIHAKLKNYISQINENNKDIFDLEKDIKNDNLKDEDYENKYPFKILNNGDNKDETKIDL